MVLSLVAEVADGVYGPSHIACGEEQRCSALEGTQLSTRLVPIVDDASRRRLALTLLPLWL